MQEPVAEALLPELHHEAHVDGDAAVQALAEHGGHRAQEHSLDGHVEIVEEDGQVADAELALRRSRRGGETHHEQDDQSDRPPASLVAHE